MDPARATQSIGENPRFRDTFDELKPDILRAINEELRTRNPLARVYSAAGEILREYQAAHEGELPRYRIIFMKRRRGDLLDEHGNPIRNAVDIPMAGGQQVLIWHDATGDSTAPVFQGVWLCHNGNFVELGKWDPLALPAAFPLIFGTGEPWFQSGMPTAVGAQRNSHRSTRRSSPQDGEEDDLASTVVEDANDADDETIVDDRLLDEPVGGQNRPARGTFISSREFFLFAMWRRPYKDSHGNTHGSSFVDTPHFVFDTGRLAQQLIMVAGAQIKARQNEGLIRHQEEEARIRTSLSADQAEYLRNQVQRQYPEAELGRYIYHPAAIPGSRRYYQEKYTDLLALKGEMGRNPEWFLTVTMNLKHPKVLAQLPDGADPLDHPDVVTRVWEEIWAKIVDDVVDKGRLGKCQAAAVVREHQGRGAPHLHMLIWVEDCPGRGTPEWVDDYITAEFPDPPPPGASGEAADQQRRLCSLMSELMVHHHDRDSSCMIDGRCKRFFPKQYSERTILNVHRFPTYQRRHPPPGNLVTEWMEGAGDPSRDAAEEEDETVSYRRRPPPPQRMSDIPAEQRNRYGNTILKKVGNTMVEIDNSMVVPTCAALLLEISSHCCLEYVGTSNVFQYLCDYCCKGAPLIEVRVQPDRRRHQEPADDGTSVPPASTEQNVDTAGAEPAVAEPNPTVIDVNEIAYETRMRYVTASETFADLAGCPLFRFLGGWVIIELYATMPGRQRVWFPEGNPERATLIRNPLHAYYIFNAERARARDTSAAHLTFVTVWKYYRMLRGKVVARQRPNLRVIARVARVSERDCEAQAHRTLLLHTPAPTCDDDLKRFPTDPAEVAEDVLAQRTFTEAARVRGLLASPEIWIRTLIDAFGEIRAERRRCRYFAVLLYNGKPTDIMTIFEALLDEMVIPPVNADPADSRGRRRQRALNRIEYYLSTGFNSTCRALGLEAPAHYSFAENDEEEQAEDGDELEQGGYVGNAERSAAQPNNYYQNQLNANVARMTPTQRDIFETIMASVRAAHADPANSALPRYFMIEGPGGVGKTLINETIIAACVVEDLRVLPTASTGVAANLLPRGATLHSTLMIPKSVQADSRPRLEGHTEIAARLRRTALLIIDEVSMLC